MKRTLVAVALVIVFVMALAAPAFAQAITHSATYQMDGVINFKKQMGHLCNTGAEIKQTIMGSGQMDKVQTVSMVKGKITMKDANDGVAGATPLTVTTVWELCAPPKYMYEDGDWVDEDVYVSQTGAVHPSALYNHFPTPATVYNLHTFSPFITLGGGLSVNVSDYADFQGFDALTEQIWAVQVQADPGYSLNVHQDGVAAEGPYMGASLEDMDFFYGTEGGWTNNKDKWRWEIDEDGVLGVGVGADFVGSFFSMDQHARTSMGTLRRYIDISSPWSHGYLMEDMSVVGKSDVKEVFGMVNLPAGADMTVDWWVLF